MAPTALHQLGLRPTGNWCILIKHEYLSQRKTPTKPLNQSKRPPLAIFLVTIFRQFNTGQSLAPLAARCDCWQCNGLQLLHWQPLSSWPRLREYGGEERATPTEWNTLRMPDATPTSSHPNPEPPYQGDTVLIPPMGKWRLRELRSSVPKPKPTSLRKLRKMHDVQGIINGYAGPLCFHLLQQEVRWNSRLHNVTHNSPATKTVAYLIAKL